MSGNVPALDRGLGLLELVATEGPLGFGEILERCDLPRASVARLLTVLRNGGWLVQETDRGPYRQGARSQLLAAGPNPGERLRLAGTPVLRDLAAACGNSAVLFQVAGARFRCLARELVEDSLVLRLPGAWCDDLGMGPWGSIVLGSLDEAGRHRARERMRDARDYDQHFVADLRDLRERGYVWHDGRARPGARRLGVPLHDRRGDLTGILGLGGTTGSMPDALLSDQAALLFGHAADLAHRLGGARFRQMEGTP